MQINNISREDKQNKNVVLFGDSIFFGIGASLRHLGCGKLLYKEYGGKVIIRARPDETSERGLMRIKTELCKYTSCPIVLVLYGNNDCRLDDNQNPAVTLNEFQRNIEAILAIIKSYDKIAILCNLQPIDSERFFHVYGKDRYVGFSYTPYDWHRNYSDLCEVIAAQQGVFLADIRGKLKAYRGQVLSNDGLHPNDAGHVIIKDVLLNAIEEVNNADI